jgi:hypothetical protein
VSQDRCTVFYYKSCRTSMKIVRSKDRERAPEIEILHAELRVLDFDLSIDSGYLLDTIIDAQRF